MGNLVKNNDTTLMCHFFMALRVVCSFPIYLADFI